MTRVEELRKGLLLQVSMMWRNVELLDSLISAAKEEGAKEAMDRVRRSIVIRYYPVGFHGDTLAPLQCIDVSQLPKFYGDSLPIKGA